MPRPPMFEPQQKHDSVSVSTAGDLRSLCQDVGDNNNDLDAISHI